VRQLGHLIGPGGVMSGCGLPLVKS